MEPSMDNDDEDERPLRGRNGRRGNDEPTSGSAQAISERDDRNVFDWLSEISGASGGGTAMQIKLYRISPKHAPDGTPIAGYLDTFAEPFTEDEVRQRWGGGKFQVKTQRQNPKGGWMYAGARQFDISGPAKVEGGAVVVETVDTPAPGPAPSVDIQKQAMGMMKDVAEKERQRADELSRELRHAGRASGDEIRQALAPLEKQIELLTRQLVEKDRVVAEKDAKILELVTRKPETTFQDRMLDKMIDGDNVRITSLRAQHESELRAVKENHVAELRALREQHRDDLNQRERVHERELATLRESHGNTLETLKAAHETRVDSLKTRASDLERQLTEARTELAELRAKKDKGIVEQMSELAHIKGAMENLGFGGGGGEEAAQPSTFERIVGTLIESPLAKAVANRVEQAPTAPPQMVPQQVRVVRPRQTVQQAAAQRHAQAAPGPAAPQPSGQVQEGSPALPPKPKKPKVQLTVSPAEVNLAITFIENAFRNSTDPVVFARSIRTTVPAQIVDYIREYGVDQFLTQVAKIPDGTPLASMAGKNYLRKVAKILVEGEAETSPETAAQPPSE